MSNKKMATIEDLSKVCKMYNCFCGVCPIGNIVTGVSCLGAIQRDPVNVSQHIFDVLSGAHTHQAPVCAECPQKCVKQESAGVSTDGKSLTRLEYRCMQDNGRLININVNATSPTWCPKRKV